MVFALTFFLFSLFLLVNIPDQVVWVKRTKLFAQPAFWPTIAIGLMVIFSLFHLVGSLVSERIPGRLQEVLYWLRSIEFALWFMAYVAVVRFWAICCQRSCSAGCYRSAWDTAASAG